MKAISTAIFLFILLIMLIVVLVPAFLIFNSAPSYSSQGLTAGTLYQQLQKYQQEQVYRGNPNIYYNSTNNPYPSLIFLYTSIPVNFNITQIYYFNGQSWVPILSKYLTVTTNTTIPLPSYVFNYPLLLVTSEGNIFFLNPNTSVTTVSISGPAGKVPVYVTSFLINGSKILPIPIQVTLGGTVNYFLTPQIFYLTPGTYAIADKNGSPIFVPQYGLTASFQNWTLVGDGTFASPTNSLSTTFTVTGPLVLTIVYKAYLQKFQVTIMPSNIPLGTNTIINEGNGVTLTPLNDTIPVYVDNKLYEVGPNGITLTLTLGYHIIEFPQYYNITFNYTSSYFGPSNGYKYGLEGGQITCYQFTGLSTSTSKISVVGTYEVFVNSSGIIYGNYKPYVNYYLVVVKNYFTFPSGVSQSYNSTPDLGDIAGQLLQVGVNGISIGLGPIKNFVPERIYFKQGTTLVFQLDYLNQLNGTFFINGEKYYGLMSCPQQVIVYNAFGSNTYFVGTYYGNYGTITVNTPLLIINDQEWEYGGQPLNG
ncbi:MAG: hypothetical protein OWQ54_10190 [Sulfolobaceae archaeon]|nr:hypothetical protein [Sulfolobaceae archaeon]